MRTNLDFFARNETNMKRDRLIGSNKSRLAIENFIFLAVENANERESFFFRNQTLQFIRQIKN